MEIASLRAFATLLIFIAFIALCFVVFSRKRKAFYEKAGNLPFEENPDLDPFGQEGDAARSNHDGGKQ